MAAAIADGARVNDPGLVPGWEVPMPPLWAAVRGQKLDNVVFLLARGARISDASALALAASLACPVVLQALIDSEWSDCGRRGTTGRRGCTR